MTEENYNYRTSQALLRNQFPGKGKLQIPVIPKFEAKPGDFDDLLLIGFDKTHLEDNNHLNRMVHFFLYGYRFERVWKNPDNDIEKLSRYDMPFELSFFDGYKKQLSPEDFCTGNTYSLWVSSSKSCYMIYSCSDAEGNLIMTKQEAYLNSQRTAHIVLTVFLLASISLWVVLLLIIHRPDLFGDRVKRFFFAKRKSI